MRGLVATDGGREEFGFGVDEIIKGDTVGEGDRDVWVVDGTIPGLDADAEDA